MLAWPARTRDGASPMPAMICRPWRSAKAMPSWAARRRWALPCRVKLKPWIEAPGSLVPRGALRAIAEGQAGRPVAAGRGLGGQRVHLAVGQALPPARHGVVPQPAVEDARAADAQQGAVAGLVPGGGHVHEGVHARGRIEGGPVTDS